VAGDRVRDGPRYVEDLPERTGPVAYDNPRDELVAARGFRDGGPFRQNAEVAVISGQR
jgi:hypothetical protein